MTGLEAFYHDSVAEGEAKGTVKGYQVSTQVIKLHLKGHAVASIVEQLNLDTETVAGIIADFDAE